MNQHGNQIGNVRQINQSALKKIFRVLVKSDGLFTTDLEILDMQGKVVLKLHKPRHFFKAKFEVHNQQGLVGVIVQQIRLGKARFTYLINEQPVGSLNAENFRAWNFGIQDAQGNDVARVSKTWAGLGKEFFTSADNYVLEIKQALDPALHAMVLASALTIDTVLKQVKA